MDTKSASNAYGQCRCCSADGYHRDIMKEYFFNGVREVYYNLIMECFNIFLSTNAVASMLICAECVQQLRAASKFRMQVVRSEERLLQSLPDQDMLLVNVPTGEHSLSAMIKYENQADVKNEVDEEHHGVGFDSDQDPDYQPEPAEASKLESADADFVVGEAELIGRFTGLPALPTRTNLCTYCPSYVRQLNSFGDKVVLPSMVAKLLKDSERQYTSKNIYLTEKIAHIINATVLIEFSNITPFKSKNRTGFPCFYCRHSFENYTKLKEHQANTHKKSEARKVLTTFGAESLIVYVDTTDLKCTICNQNIPNINELKSHLIKTHNKTMYLDATDRVIPFKLNDDCIYECQVCGCNFETFGAIERHMNVHYRNYICKECGTGFVTKYRLKVHIKSMHVDGNFPCEQCKKVYSSHQKLKNHTDTVHKMLKRFKCPKCPERFSEYFRRQKHMVTVHGVAPLLYKCNVCEKAFDRRYTLSRHMKRDHLEERDYQCELCSYNCFTNNELRVHMIKHNGERIFQCSVCNKSYARKKTLKEHMRIHNNDRRFACAVCGQAFVQKCSLKGHIKTHHVEFSLQV